MDTTTKLELDVDVKGRKISKSTNQLTKDGLKPQKVFTSNLKNKVPSFL